MSHTQALAILGLGVALAVAPHAPAQQGRPYLGFVYPAGGQQGTTFRIRVGGQGLDDVQAMLITGSGITAKVVERYQLKTNRGILMEQLQDLKPTKKADAAPPAPMVPMTPMAPMTPSPAATPTGNLSDIVAKEALIARLEKRIDDFVQTPASQSIATLIFIEVTIAPDAVPGVREIRLAALNGISNPLVFQVGQLPEYSRKPMRTAMKQELGKEEQALRKRPSEEVEDRITLPCTINGQIASGEANRYRFSARQGQWLVFTTLARQLVPYIADAVPGWFQPVLALYDSSGKEVAYDDDYRFKPDPTLVYQVPRDGEYVLSIYDAIYRGRDDFVYRITAGELPFVTGIFPLGARVGEPVTVKMQGVNLQEAELTLPDKDAGPGVYPLAAKRKGFLSNPVPFTLDTLPESSEKESNNDPRHAMKVTLPVIINGRIDQADDWDVFRFSGRSNNAVVAEVCARRLDSPLDSVLKLTDANGKLLAFNDDCEDLASGLNTHHADSYFLARLPADGTYYVHIGDTARKGGEAYAYRLRLSAPRPDFALRVVPSSASLRSKSGTTLTVYAIWKDGFTGPVTLGLKDPPAGFSASPVSLTTSQAMAQFSFKTDLVSTNEPVNLVIEGRAAVGEGERVHRAVPAEDRMQAFLWRHLVPAQEFKVLVIDPAFIPPLKRVPPDRPTPAFASNIVVAGVSTSALAAIKNKVKPFKDQLAEQLKDMIPLYGEGLLTDDFYNKKAAQAEATLAVQYAARNWPGWRGAYGDGSSSDWRTPVQWTATSNVVWRAELPGRGHGAPVVWSLYIFLLTAGEPQGEACLVCLDRTTGKVLWQHVLSAAPTKGPRNPAGAALSTPATDGERIYCTFPDNEGMAVAAYDFNGRQLWLVHPSLLPGKQDFCSSPVLFKDKVIVNGDPDGTPALVALHRDTGKTLWTIPRGTNALGSGVPLIRDVGGKAQMILSGSNGVASYNPNTGTNYWILMAPTGHGEASPVFNERVGLIFFAGGLSNLQVLGIRPYGKGKIATTNAAWCATNDAGRVSSAVSVGDYFIAASDGGTVTCYQARDGTTMWRERFGAGHAPLVTINGLVYCLADTGVTTVFRPGPTCQVMARNELGEACVTAPAVSDGQIFLCGDRRIFCIGTRPY